MAEKIPDGSFELGGSWSEIPGNSERVTEEASSGSWSMRLTGKTFPPSQGITAVELVDLAPGFEYPGITLYRKLAYAQKPTAFFDVEIQPDPPFGDFSRIYTGRVGDQPTSWTQLVADGFTAVQSTANLRLIVNAGSGFGESNRLYVDQVSLDVEDGLVITDTLRAALILDLEWILEANGASVDLEKVYPEPVAMEKAVYPHAALIPNEGGDSRAETTGGRQGRSVQVFTVQLAVKGSATPHADLAKLLDDVRNAVERKGSAILAAAVPTGATVYWADVSEWSNVLTTGDISNQLGQLELDVTIEYSYLRGGA